MSARLAGVLATALMVTWLASGCKSDKKSTPEDDSKQQSQNNKSSDRQAPAPNNAPGGRDAEDSQAPQVQGIFPASDTQWAKKIPVRFYPAAELGSMVDAAYYEPYGVDWAADALYQLGTSARQRLVVQVFHCRVSSDAYGLMSVASDDPFTPTIGQESRGGIGVQLRIWTGNFYLYLWSEEQQGLAFLKAMQEMARQIVSGLPKDGVKPELVKVLPARDQIEGQVYYFRGPKSLQSSGLTNLVHEQALAESLQLTPADSLAMASYRVPGLKTRCFVFIARFADSIRAQTVYDRLTRTQEDPKTRFADHLMTGGVENSCVYGTVTAEEYGWLEGSVKDQDPEAYPVFPTIRKRLADLR